MSKRAWVTLATNDSYGLGALVMAHSLRRAGSVYPAVVLITPSVTQTMRDRLSAVFAEVIMVNVLDSQDAAHLALLQRPELGITFTKIHCWNLSQYEKCVFLDADTLVIQNSDELFEREELSAAPDVGWPDCFNSGVFVFSPSPETFEKLIKFAQERGSFDGGDQGLLNSFFSDWAHGDINKHLPFVYNVTSAAFYSYLPALKHYGQNLKIIHFIGAAKPWLQQYNWESGSVDAPEHLREFLQLWWDLFVANVHAQLDITMVEVEEAPPEFPELPELPPQDVFHYYEPLVDPQSKFLWHHPKTQDVESNESKIDVKDFFDPWEHCAGNILKNNDEIQKDRKPDIIGSFFWEHSSQKNDKQLIHLQESSEKYNLKSEPLKRHHNHNDIDIHYYEQQQHHSHYHNLQLQNHYCQSNNAHHQKSKHDYQPVDYYFQFKSQQHDYDEQSSELNNNRHKHDHQSFEQHIYSHINNQHHSHQTSEFYNEHHIPHNNTVTDEYHDDRVKNNSYLEHLHYKNEHDFHIYVKHEQKQQNCDNIINHHTDSNYNLQHKYSADCNTQHKNQLEDHNSELQPHYQDLPNSSYSQNRSKKQQRSLIQVYQVQMDHFVNSNSDHSIKELSKAKGDLLEEDNEYHEEIIPRHPYDGFYLRHKATINSHGRKICLHELVQPSAPPDGGTTSKELSETNDQSGVAGNLARVVPGTAGCQREALDELNRRQGWEAGNIDYMGADSFENIWAKISQTLSQPRSSPPKQSPPREATPPQKQPSPPPKQSPFRETTSPQKQPLPVKDQSESQTEITGSEVKQETVSESIEVAQEALTIDAPVVQDESVAAKISSSEEEPKAQEISLPVKAETPAELPTPKEVSIPEAHPIPEVVPTSENPITGKNVALVETSAPEQIEPTVGAAVSKEVLQGKSSSIVESSVHETISAEVEPTPVKDAATVEADILTAITDSPAIVDLTVLKESPALVKAPETIAVEAPVLLEATVPVEKTSKTVVESSVVKEKVACVAKAAAPSEDSTKVTPNPTVEDPVLVPSGTSDSIPSQVLPSPVEHDIPKTVANVETEIATQSPSSVLSKDLEKLKKDPVLQKTDKTEKTPPATPKSTPEATTPITESTIKADPLAAVQIAAASTGSLESQKVIGTPVVVPASPISTDIPASTVPEPKATPEKPLNVKTATDSPPLANTPSKEEAPALPVAKSEERRKPVGKLHLSPPVVADPLPTPDSELEDAATLAQSIIASELKTPTVSSPSPSTVPISPMPPKQEKRLSVEEPEVPTPPVGAVSLAQIGVKPSKGKPNTAALIESSVTEKSDPVQRDNNAPVSPTKTSEPTTDVKKKAVKKSAKESSSSEAPVPPPRKKEKKPKDK